MLNLILSIGLANIIGGRSDDIFGKSRLPAARAIFRCILPSIMAAAFAYEKSHSLVFSFYVWFAVCAGSALWFPWGWSFDEINGTYDDGKYPLWLRKIGLWVYPLDGFVSTNRERGILTKGIRGSFDILTFALLAPFNPWIMLCWLPTCSMGIVFYLAGKIFKESPVAWGELIYGCIRGALIGISIMAIN